MVEGAAIAAIRAYDLPLGMRLLRARSYLGPSASPGLAAGYATLAPMQGTDGSFGDIDFAVARSPAAGGAQAARQVRAVLAFQALWTLGQVEDPTSPLIRRAFPRARPGRSGECDQC